METKKLTSPLLAGLKGNERDTMINQLLASQLLLKRMKEVIEKEINSLDDESTQDFDSPSWAYKQAFKLGVKKGLTNLLKYVIIDS